MSEQQEVLKYQDGQEVKPFDIVKRSWKNPLADKMQTEYYTVDKNCEWLLSLNMTIHSHTLATFTKIQSC